MKKQLFVVGIAALLATACSGTEGLVGPSKMATGTSATRSTADDAPTGNAAISQPSEAPIGFTFVSQSVAHEDGKQSFFLAWTPVINVRRYELSIERYDNSINSWVVMPFMTIDAPPTKLQLVLPAGRYRARVRNAFPAALWTNYIDRTTDSVVRAAVPVVPNPAWWWAQVSEGEWELCFG